MDLQEQLAALAAGELDAADARALRARVAADPALARQLARLERLESLLAGWDAPAMSEDAVARLDAVVDEALAELDEAPLQPDEPVLHALTDPEDGWTAGAAGAGTSEGNVVDLEAARRRRGLPTWLTGAAAAGLLGIVAIGIGANLTKVSDQADVVAGEATGDSAATFDGGAADESTMAEMAPAEPEAAAGSAQGGAYRLDGITLAAGDLLALSDEVQQQRLSVADDDADAESAPRDEAEEAAGTDGASDGEADCVREAVERDTASTGDTVVELLGSGTYAGRDARFVVLRLDLDDRVERHVLAYEPGSCRLLDADSETL